MKTVEFMLARIFGKKAVGIDNGWVTVAYHWRGRFYVTYCGPEKL